jgi:hypothetical protein
VTAQRARRAVLAAYAFALLVMVLIPPFEGENGKGIEYASVFERPMRFPTRTVIYPNPFIEGGAPVPVSVNDESKAYKASIMWGRGATQVAWLTLAAGLGFAAAPMIARRAHRRP